jgi:hypothetical protein
LNAARIHDIGLDSEVMVGGDAYSDALIYQARLMDPDAPPTGVGLVPLASEAVAFLADDMLGGCTGLRSRAGHGRHRTPRKQRRAACDHHVASGNRGELA